MTPVQVELILLLTDKVFALVEHMREVGQMAEDEVMNEIARERFEKDSLMEEVTL